MLYHKTQKPVSVCVCVCSPHIYAYRDVLVNGLEASSSPILLSQTTDRRDGWVRVLGWGRWDRWARKRIVRRSVCVFAGLGKTVTSVLVGLDVVVTCFSNHPRDFSQVKKNCFSFKTWFLAIYILHQNWSKSHFNNKLIILTLIS